MDLLNIESHKHNAELLNNMFASSLIPIINKPTRITYSTATLIDICYPNETYLIIYLQFVLFPIINLTVEQIRNHKYSKKEI